MLSTKTLTFPVVGLIGGTVVAYPWEEHYGYFDHVEGTLITMAMFNAFEKGSLFFGASAFGSLLFHEKLARQTTLKIFLWAVVALVGERLTQAGIRELASAIFPEWGLLHGEVVWQQLVVLVTRTVSTIAWCLGCVWLAARTG